MSVITLAVAGLPIEIVSAQREIIQTIAEQYAPFISQSRPLKVVQLQLVDRSHFGQSLDAQVTCEEGQITIRSFGFEGSFAPEDMHATLRTTCSNPLNSIENFLRQLYAALLIQHQGLLIHAASIVNGENKGYIFCGPSGIGKTTVARLSLPRPVVSDDLTVIRRVENRFQIFPSPFHGEMDWIDGCHMEPCDVRMILELHQDTRTYLQPLSRVQATTAVMSNAVGLVSDRAFATRALDLCLGLTGEVPCYALYFLPHRKLWEVI